jgi:hypothetical protein
MNTLIETRRASLRLSSPEANSFDLPVMPVSMAEVRARFVTFAAGLDLAPIKYKLLKDKGWTLERANRVEPQYKAFLFLIGSKVRAEFVPTFDIDEMWHAHILDTRKYMTDCARWFGEYIHHYPYLGMKDAEDRSRAEGLFASTCATISAAFGIDVHELDASSCGSGCGHGCGGHGCGGGHSSCGSGHSDGSSHDSGHSDGGDASILSIISGCSASDGGKRKPEEPKDEKGEGKRGFWRNFFGLSPLAERADWFASVSPELFDEEYRPGASLLDKVGGLVN